MINNPCNIIATRIDEMNPQQLAEYHQRIEKYREQKLIEETERFNNADKITLKEYLKTNPEGVAGKRRMSHDCNTDLVSILCSDCKNEISYEKSHIFAECYWCDTCCGFY